MWHRRSGKDLTDLNIIIAEMMEHVGNYYYFFPTFAQGKKVIWEGKTKDEVPFLDYFPKELVDGKPNDSELKIKFKNGSMFQLIGTDNFDAIMGTNPIGCVFSEFSLQNPKAWDYIRPILTENGGWAIFNFTPRGLNHAWKLLQQAKNSPRWFWQVLTVKDTQAISEENLEEERKEMPDDLFRQEFYCEFIESAGAVFKGVDACVYEGDLTVKKEHTYQLGVDLAKFNDWTVLTPFSLVEFKSGKPDRFNQIDYPLQKAKIAAKYFQYGKPKTNIDATGVGAPIVDDLIHEGLGVEGITFTEQMRRDLLINLGILLEQRKIKIPNDPTLIDELKSFQYTLTPRGRTVIGVPEGMHDDCVMSLALAVWGIPEKPLKPRSQAQRELVKQFDANRNKRKSFAGLRY